jgi:hypothetical protein
VYPLKKYDNYAIKYTRYVEKIFSENEPKVSAKTIKLTDEEVTFIDTEALVKCLRTGGSTYAEYDKNGKILMNILFSYNEE